MKKYLFTIALCLILISLFFGCVQSIPKEQDSEFKTITMADLSKKLDMPLIESTKEVDLDSVSILQNTFSAKLEANKTYPALNNAFEHIGLSIQSTSKFNFEGGLENSDENYVSGYSLGNVYVVSEFKKTTTPIIRLDKVRSQDSIKHMIKIKNNNPKQEEIILDLEYKILDAENIIWDNEIYELNQGEILEFTAFEKEIQYSDGFSTTHSIPIAEIEANLKEGGKTILDFSDIMFEKHRALITYDGENALVKLQVTAIIEGNSEYIIDPYLSYVPPYFEEPSQITIQEDIDFLEISDVNKDKKNDLILVSGNKINIFYDYLEKQNFENPDKTFTVEGERILSFEVNNNEILIGVFPIGIYVIDVDLINQEEYISKQSAINVAGSNFYGGDINDRLYFITVPNYDQKGGITYISEKSSFENYAILHSDYSSITTRPKISCNSEICCFGNSYESKVYCIKNEDLELDNTFKEYKDLAYLTISGPSNIGKEILIINNDLIISSQYNIHYLSNIVNQEGQINVENYPSTSEKVGYGQDLFNYNNTLFVSSSSGIYEVNPMDQGNIGSTNTKYEIDKLSDFSISENGNYVALTLDGEMIYGEELPTLFSMMDVNIITGCGDITESGDYILNSDLIVNNDICINVMSTPPSSFILDCQGHTITAIGDNAEAIRIDNVAVVNVRNCNFIVENSNSVGVNTSNTMIFTSQNCNFNVSNGEYSYAIKSNSLGYPSASIVFSDLNILMNKTIHSNAIQLENMRNSINFQEILIELNEVADTVGIVINTSNSVSLFSCEVNSLDQFSEKVVGYSLKNINILNLNDANVQLIGKGVTGIAIYDNSQNAVLENSNYLVTGKGLVGVYLDNSLMNVQVKNIYTNVEENTIVTEDIFVPSMNSFVESALPHSSDMGSKYSWIYSLFSNNGVTLAGIKDNEFRVKCLPPSGGLVSGSASLNKIGVRLNRTYDMIFENNLVYSEHCISLYSETSYGRIKNNEIIRASDILPVAFSFLPTMTSSLFEGNLLEVNDKTILIEENKFTSSVAGVTFGEVSTYNNFRFNNNQITDCPLHGLAYFDISPIEQFLNNYICNNGFYSGFYYDIYGTNILNMPLPDFDTTICTDYNFITGGFGNCIIQCFDCPSIDNFNITANCVDYVNTGFVGTWTAPWSSLDIPTVYSNDTICLTSNFTNPSLQDLIGYINCYNLGIHPTPIAGPDIAHYNPGFYNVIALNGDPFINILAGNNLVYDRSIPSTSIRTCNYYQCFSYWDPQAGLPAGCINDWQELFFFVENRAPTISVAPTITDLGDRLLCDITATRASFDDPDGDSPGTPIRYSWYVNGDLQTVTSSILMVDYYSPGDTITCTVSIPDNSDCPQLYSNELSNSTFIQAEGWVAVDPYPEGYTDSIYYCDFDYQMPYADNYNINITWYAFDSWTGDWSTSDRNDPFIIYETSYEGSDTSADNDPGTSLDYSLEKCHYLACEVNITALDGDYEDYSLIGNSTMLTTEFPIHGQGGPTYILNRPPVLTGEPSLTIYPLSGNLVSIYCDSSAIDFSDSDYNDRDFGRRDYSWSLNGFSILGQTNFALVTVIPPEGGIYGCCVEMFDLIVNGNCQGSDVVCGDITIPPRTLSFDVNLSADPTTDYLAPPGLRTTPTYDDDCEPIKYGDTRVNNCAYEDSNFTCTIHNVVYTGFGLGPTTKDVIIYDNDGNVFVDVSSVLYDSIVYYNNDPDTGCLDNPDCQKGDILYCNVTLYDDYGVLETFTSNPVQIHNFIPEISKPEVYVITDALPDDIRIGNYNGTYLKTNYADQFLCIPSDEWQQGNVLPDYNNDTWENISYYWEWSAVDTGYINTTTGCDYTNIYGNRCSNNECFETDIKNYLCSLQTARDVSGACDDLENILCWGPDIDNESHWLPFVPMAELRNLDGFEFIANTNVTYGVCDWASLGGLTGCPPAGEFEIECINGEWVGTDPCRTGLYNTEMDILKQCEQGTAQCYELLESCSFSNSYTPPGIVYPSGSCPSTGLVTIAGFDLTPEDVVWEDPWSTGGITTWDYDCANYGGTYRFWHTSWYLRGPYISYSTPYRDEANPCNANDYFGVKTNPDLPSFSMWNTYLSDIHGLFYEKDKPHGIPIRCCINQSDEGFETTYSDMACSDPTCGNYLDCGPCYYDEDGILTCYSKANCISGDEEQCYIYLQDSCNEEILWKITEDACSGVDTKIRCYYNYTNGTAFNVERHIDLSTGLVTIEQTDEVQECYPCMQYWPMEADDDFNETDFNEEWGYYYNPWWLRDLLFNESYIPITEGYSGDLPTPDKVALNEISTVSFENITMDTSDNIIEPCNPNGEECDISLHEWWSGPYGAQQNNTFKTDSYDSVWAEEYGSKTKEQLADEFDISEDNIVGRFFATTFKYCNQWDEDFVKGIVDYSDESIRSDYIDSYYGNEWPNVELGILTVGHEDYPFAGRDGQDSYLTSGIFSHENGIGSSQYLVWNSEWPEGYAQYNELECDNYEQCRKHARISADHVFGVVYNTTYKHITCDCPEDLSTDSCEEFGDPNSIGLPGDRVWEFNRNTCSCYAVCGPKPAAPNCTLIEPGTVPYYNDHLCEWECRIPVTPRLIIPGTSGGSGYGTGIHWAGIEDELGDIIEVESTYALLAGDDYYPEARFGPDGSDGFPTCGINEIQNEDSNCFISDEYYNALYEYSLTHNVSNLSIGSVSADISLDCSNLDMYSDYSNARRFCHYSYSLWDLDSCQTHDEERIGFILDNNYKKETENEGCGFCQGLLINNTAPSIDYLGIIANDEPPTNFTCTIDGFNDIDTHPADLIKNATFRWCPYGYCDVSDEYTRETVLGEDANSTYVNSALPIDPATGDPIIYCCAQVYDTDWQSKQSEEYCQAYSAEAPEECNITLEGIASVYISDISSVVIFEVYDNYTFVVRELPYRIADIHLIYEGSDIGAYSCYQTTDGIVCESYTGSPDIVIGELDLGNYQIIANNSEKGCYSDSKDFRIVSGTPITNCTTLTVLDAHYYLANDINVNGNIGDNICAPTLTSTTPNLGRFVSTYPDCLYCCIIVDANDISIDLNGYSITSNVDYNPSSLDRLGGICAKQKTDVEIYNSNTLNGGLFKWDRGITFLKSNNTNINHVEIDSLASTGSSRANEYYMSGISLSGCENTILNNNRIARYTSGIETFYSKLTNIINNIFAINSFGITTSWVGDSAGPSSVYRIPIGHPIYYPNLVVQDLNIFNNSFLDCGSGIKGYRLLNTNIKNNSFVNNRYIGINLLSSGSFIFISNNTIINVPKGIHMNYFKNGMNIIFAENEISNSDYGILISHTSEINPVFGAAANHIYNCGTGFQVSDSNNIDLQLSNNIIENNQKGVLLDYSLNTFAFDSIPNMDTSEWPEGSTKIKLCDSDPSIGCYDHHIPVSSDCSNKISLWTSKECYSNSEDININIQRVCRGKTNSLGIVDYPNSIINLNIIDSSETLSIHTENIGYGAGRPYEFSIYDLSESRYTINGTINCVYSNSSLNHSFEIINETFEVSSTCPENYYIFKSEGFNSNPSFCWPINSEISDMWITYHTVSEGITEFIPDLEIYNSLGDLELASDGGDTCFTSSNIILDNNEICDNTIYDINDTLIYCGAPSTTETDYTDNTCDTATSYSVDDNLICSDICGTNGGGDTCNCDVEIVDITWPAHDESLPDAVCGGENVTIKVEFTNTDHCSGLDLDEIELNIIRSDILSSILDSRNANSTGYYSYQFDRHNTDFGEYRVTATHSVCSRTTDTFPFGQCFGEYTCQQLNAVCNETLVCCNPDNMSFTGYDFYLTCVGFCCVPEGGICYPDYTNITGIQQCCPGSSCLGGICRRDINTTTNTTSDGDEDNESLLNLTDLFRYPNCSFDDCNRTSDCCSGYCYRNVCMGAPATVWLFSLYPRAGCEGLPIEPIGILGFIICDLMWLWVLITALIAAYKSRQNYRMPIPIFAFIFPFVVALFLYPYLGVLVGIFEILIFLRKQEDEEFEYEEKKARGEFTDESFSDNSNFE